MAARALGVRRAIVTCAVLAGAAINVNDGAVAIPLLVVTLTQPELQKLDTAIVPPFTSDSLNEVLIKLGIGSQVPDPGDSPQVAEDKKSENKKKLLRFYGARRADWKPFGGSENIETIVDSLKDEINQLPTATRFRWEPLEESFWTGNADARNFEISKLLKGPSVIVIDPLSLYYSNILFRFNQLEPCFRHPMTAVLVLTPFCIAPPAAYIRDMMKEAGGSPLRIYYKPPIPLPSAYASCNLNIADKVDFERSLLSSLGKYIAKRAPASGGASSPYTGTGA